VDDARCNLDQGPVTPDYFANRETVIKRLNDALARERVCVLRDKQVVLAEARMVLHRACREPAL
jgi:hypothetical protein